VAAAVVAGVFWVPPIVEAGAWRAVAGLGLVAVVVAAMLLRRRFPAYAVAAAGAATVAATLLGVCDDPMLATAWCVYPLAFGRASRAGGPFLVLAGVVAVLAAVTAVPEESWGEWGQRPVIAAAALSVSWLLGVTAGKQVAAAREAERARAAERAARVQLSVARDVHDVVGHALGVISAEAGVTRSLPDTSDQELRDALSGIESHARTALQDVQALVRTLRSAGHPNREDPAPQNADAPNSRPVDDRSFGVGMVVPLPRLSELPELVAATRAAGVRVSDRVAVPGEVGEAVEAVAYRIVQEALANVVRHAPGAACELEVRRDGSALVVRVRDDGPGMGGEPGFGLRGMWERARLVGGTVTWRNLPEGAEVEARLPLEGPG